MNCCQLEKNDSDKVAIETFSEVLNKKQCVLT